MTRLNIKKENCLFIINEEKRTVVCIIQGTRSLVYHFLDKNSWTSRVEVGSICFEPRYDLGMKLMLPDKFIGKAVCSTEDKWDPEVGKLIAFNRAKNKLNNAFFKRAQLFAEEVDRSLAQVVNSFNEYGERLSEGQTKREAKIEELTKG